MIRISCPAEAYEMVQPGWRVLDVGSGDRPFPKATALVDRLPRKHVTAEKISTENPTASIVRQGKPFVEGDIVALPFRERAFDFVHAAHVLEHTPDPLAALAELTRVAPRGYLECPRAWFEFVDSSPFHLWLIDLFEGELWIRPKTETEAQFMASRRLYDFSPQLFAHFYGVVFHASDPGRGSIERSLCHLCLYWEETIPARMTPPATYLTTP